ncbi:hypothetical protein DAPPUDRAFT_257723 [Daphnia pulex]|uniref:Uncharacterized protein n=1 Tax=Daphnia pulex TaxID=6669 RepID=E9HE32_DAPPU|nr:hypothetical protein DAPPUDRAFT_257723 [Daphnia pulex]|eukprot:EFX69942.1 hypothetical protein DAPPUDRAFT_257723 [Daphnia pulex]
MIVSPMHPMRPQRHTSAGDFHVQREYPYRLSKLQYRLHRMEGCQAESKAALMPRKAQQEDIFFFFITNKRERDAVSVERPDLKPC